MQNLRSRKSNTTLGVALGLLSFAAAATAVEPSKDSGLWREVLKQDLAFINETMRARYIYALTEGDAFDKKLSTALAEAENTPIENYGGYRAVMTRFAGEFDDAHVRVSFPYEPVSVEWPRFMVRYQANTYVVVESEIPTVAKGATLSSCDGKPLDRIVDDMAPLTGNVKGLESTRDSIARTLFVDGKNPLYARPAQCVIGGTAVELKWVSVSLSTLNRLNEAHAPPREAAAAVTLFGKSEAWLRMSTMQVGTPEAAKQFHDVIDHAAGLRDKDLIVFDVRSNPGGEYNWFMAVVRALYGDAYTDYYARARLQIRPVMMDDPRAKPTPWGPQDAAAKAQAAVADPFDTPPDSALNALLGKAKLVERPAANGKVVYALMPDGSERLPAKAPKNPLKAKVYVLTDYGCASACIAFVDEMKRFPGVVQVGQETFIDSRSGTPRRYTVPSGLSSITLPSMVREGRERGDNIPQLPKHKFAGDIADTDAVKAWIEGLAGRPVASAIPQASDTLPSGTKPILLMNAEIVDGTGVAPVKRGWVRIENGLIAATGPGRAPAVRDAEVFDLNGSSVYPGLSDMHVHIGRPAQAKWMLKLLLANGVTNVKVAGNWTDATGEAHDPKIRDWLATEPNAPHVYFSGMAITGRRSAFINAQTIKPLLEASLATHPDFLKTRDFVDADAIKVAAVVAKEHNLYLTGHIPTHMTSVAAIDSGMTVLEHLFVEPEEITTTPPGKPGDWAYYWKMWGDVDLKSDRVKRTLAAWAARKGQFFVDPTLVVVQAGAAEAGVRPPPPRTETDSIISPAMERQRAAGNEPRASQPSYNVTEADKLAWARGTKAQEQFVAMAYHRGVRILTGTDLPVARMAAGETLLQELALMVDGGLTPAEVIHASTANAAQALRREDRGTIQVGQVADLVVVKGDVAKDIGATRHIEHIFLGGRHLDPHELLAEARTLAAQDTADLMPGEP